MKKLFTLMCVIALSLVSVFAYEVPIGEDGSATSQVLPIALQGTSELMPKYSISQQIYLASELSDGGASEGDIIAIKYFFNHASNDQSLTRNLQVWVMESDLTEFSMTVDNPGNLVYDANYKAGTLVFEGAQIIKKNDYTITFNKNGGKFHWNGSKNIIVTVYDYSGVPYAVNRHVLKAMSAPRFLHQTTYNVSPAWNMDDLRGVAAKSSKSSGSEIVGHKYVNRISFIFEDPTSDPDTPPSTPEDLAASNIGATSASLSWTAVDGATSYKLYHSTSADGLYTEIASPATNSYNWTGLTASTTYYVKVSAVNGVGESDLSDPISFTTQSPHIHDDITFEPWSNSSAIPTSGNYFLTTDVELASSSNETLSGNLNLCLNGHIILTSSNCIIVPDAVTFAIYDNEGTGVIRGAFPGDLDNSGLISIKAGGTLSISEGGVVNLADDASDYNYAIDNKGTLNLSGTPNISGVKADIYLATSKYITIESGKPLTNTTPYSVNAVGQTITSGWSNMGEANPANYFTSAKSGYPLVKLVDGEAKLVSVITLSEGSDNSTAITGKDGIESDIRLTRSLTSSQYNTFCLPFALTNAELQSAFGAGYDLQEFVSSSLVEETLELTFNKVTALEAGKPYLLKPSVDVVNPIFQNVTITATSPVNQTSDTYISFYGIYSPTELEGGNKNILFLGAENELFWPETTENLKGFRAYFELKGGAAKVAKRARIINKEEAPTSLDEVQGNNLQRTKFIENGQLFILYNGAKYNVQGQVIK